ncbi:MAG TPA: hypothetical protein VJ552_10600 [Sediminibacterium sp.]|nr:hypothetical protein [Sediminibacterium sp.]
MSRNTILTSLLVLGTILCGTAIGQKHSAEHPPADSTRETAAATLFSDTAILRISDSLAADRLNMHKTNLTILAAWAGVNIIQGSISANNAQGRDRHFFNMNAYWNLINMGIATYGLIKIKKGLARKYSYSQNLLEQQKLEKILLLNSGLDLAYIATGLYLKERGARLNREQPAGFGNSLILQGAFLLVFDLVQYGNHRRNGKILEQQMGNLQFGPTRNGIGLAYHFE